MVLAHHLMWTAYGYWLPNDPRGSMSHEVAAKEIAELGPRHYGRSRPAVQSSSEMRQFRLQARAVLKHELLPFGEADFPILACGFADVINTRNYTCFACAIMPDHVHLLIRKHRDKGEAMIEKFQQATREMLIESNSRPPEHPVWGGPGWNVFQDSQRQVENTIQYIRNNPAKIGRPVQVWPFVTEYNGWTPGVR